MTAGGLWATKLSYRFYDLNATLTFDFQTPMDITVH